jgi:ABC-type Na+ efflux pump permease subunit
MNVWRATRLIVGKDLRTYFRDRAGVLLGFLLPIALVTVFGFIGKFAFGGAGGMPRVTLWLTDADQSVASTRFIKALRAVAMLQVRPRQEERSVSEVELRRLVRDGEIHHALVIEPGFAASVDALQVPRLTMVRDPDRALEDRVIRVGVLEALVGFLGESLGPERAATMRQVLRGSGLRDEQIQQFLGAAQAVQDSLGAPSRDLEKSPSAPTESNGLPRAQGGADMFGEILKLVPIENEDFTQAGRLRKYPFHYAQAVSGVTVMMVMFGLMVCSSTLISERDSGTLARLMVMAVPRSSIFWGKYVFSALVGLVQLAVFFIYGDLIFGIDAFRDPITLVLLSVTWTAAANSFGMLVAVWARTARQAETLSSILILVMAGVGGCWFPTQLMDLPPAAEIATRFTLTYWAMAGFQGMFWDQLPWTHPKMLSAVGIQWAFAVLASVASLALYRRRYLAG